MYGPTETTIWSSVKLIRDPDTITIGKPIANTTMFVLDEKLNPVGVDEKGELYIGGDGLAKGYWCRPELSNERFITHPLAKGIEPRLYKTGDAAKYNNDREIICLGRMDNQVKINGYRIELGEIEAAIETIKEVEKAVLVVNDIDGHKALHAFLLYKDGAATLDNKALTARLANSLPAYMLPAEFHQVTTFPLTLNGKVDRNKIVEQLKSDAVATPATQDASALAIDNIPVQKTVLPEPENPGAPENLEGLRQLLIRDLTRIIKTLLMTWM
jgi:acyl-coenzyme A synthetase/AMP-(fatty) acid ligase